MKEQILQIVLQNLENKEDIVKIRLVENLKSNLARILKKIGDKTYQVKNIRLRDKRIVEVIKVKKLNRKVVQFVTKNEIFQVDLRKSKNKLLEDILRIFTIKNNRLILKPKIKNIKGLIGVVINSELFIQGDNVQDLVMAIIVWKGLRQGIFIQGIAIKDSFNNTNFELVSKLEIKYKDNSEYLNFSDRSQKWEVNAENNDKLCKSLAFIWKYINIE